MAMPQDKRILIVEDEEGLSIHLAFLLRRIHYTPLEPVVCGEDAVEQVGVQRPDLVLMDIHLAGAMNGIQAAQIIHARYGTPVIFLSAASEDEIITEAAGSDPWAYLLKPVQEPALRAAIDIALYRQAMEARLRESEERYRMLFETMRSGFSLYEAQPQNGDAPRCPAAGYRILAINPAFLRMFRLEHGASEGRTVGEVFAGRDMRRYMDALDRAARDAEPEQFEIFAAEVGRFLEIQVYSPREGQVASIVEDITERKMAEISLKDSETRFRQLAEGISEVFWLRQRSGEMLYVSPAYERVFGISDEELITNPQTFFTCIHDEDRPRVVAAMSALEERGVVFSEEYRILRPDGVTRWVWARIYPVAEESGEVRRFSGIAEDITERRRSEVELRESYSHIERSLHRMAAVRNVDLAITTHTDQSSMAEAILANVVDSDEIEAAVLFVPNLPTPGRPRGTGPLGALRLAGIAGLPETALDGSVLNWQMLMVSHVFESCQPLYINDLRADPHPGAQTLARAAGFNTCAVLPLLTRGQSKGVLQFFHRQGFEPDADWQTFLQSLALQAAIGIDHVEMLENLKRSNRELVQAYDETIRGWAQALELRDKETRGHAGRVTELTVRLAAAMGFTGEALDHIRRGAFLHDIGKMAIPDSILGKTSPLTQDDWITMRQHPTIGYRMLSTIGYLKPALDVVYCHHERWDGSGYPRGLKGDEIPVASRIFSIVDVWDALTNNRPYRLAWPEEEVRMYLRKESAHQFDPRIVDEFLKLV
jgi:PAS domain S-box-containing protein/putative nucleotidyltransferase with HDIG domain